MAIVTIISDWNQKDHYLGALKGELLKGCPDAQLIDISHEISSFNIQQAGFVLRNVFQHYPDGTIHMQCVSRAGEGAVNYIFFSYKGHYFLSEDNGIIGILGNDSPDWVLNISDPEVRKNLGDFNEEKYLQGSFPSLNLFVPIVIRLLNGRLPEVPKDYQYDFNSGIAWRPAISEKLINGSVIYIDSYKNAITNINREVFKRVGRGEAFTIFLKSNYYKLNRIDSNYHETPVGEILALFNESELLEISMNGGNASDLLKLEVGSVIRIKFDSKD